MSAFAKDVNSPKRKPTQVQGDVTNVIYGNHRAGYDEMLNAINTVGKCGDEFFQGARAEIVCTASKADGKNCTIYKIQDCK